MSYCVHCGVELDATASFCPLCHTRVPVACGENSVKRKSGLCIGDKGLCIYI